MRQKCGLIFCPVEVEWGGIMKSKLCINKIIQISRIMQHTFHNMDAIIILGVVDQKDSNLT